MSEQKNPLPQLLLIFVACFFGLGMDKGCAIPIIAPIDPPPFKTDKLCVLVVEETDDRGTYSAGQREAMTSLEGPGSIRSYVKSKSGEFLLWDKDQQPTANSPKWVADALKVRGDRLPWIVAATPKSGLTREMPKEAAETVAAIAKIGGTP